MYDTQEPLRESALLIGLERPGHDKWAVKDSLEELRELAVSAGAEVLDLISQKRDTPAAATFIGAGKAGELAARCRDAVTLIKTRTWQLAKRQLTWFRREPHVEWLEIGREELPLDTAKRILQAIQHGENNSVS